MRRFLISLMAIAAVAISCHKEIEPQEKPVPTSDYLVIKAECTDVTKTDINAGKSSWEKGDIIEVVYKGDVYEYTADEDGSVVHFTSENGIADYDGSAVTAYYKAENAAEGVVGIGNTWTIESMGTDQVNSACAPLVGTPVSEKAENGILSIMFDNIFSVMELRIDPTGKTTSSPIKSLTVEPADAADFDGYLTFTGSVDPQTLALTAAENGTGNSLTINLPADMDIAKAHVLKFPVGRFSTTAGLKLTLEVEDGEKFEKTVYKNGVKTYNQIEGIFSVKHLAKAMYSFVPTHFSGGDGTAANPYAIATVQDLLDLSTYVASKEEEFLPFRTAHYIQIDDIDFEGSTLPSIGNTNDAAPYSFFCGKFDGNGYKVSNVVIANTFSNKATGFFGYIDGEAHIKNLKLDHVTVNATTWNVATIVGCVQPTATLGLIENCTVTNASVKSSSNSIAGIVGKLMTGTIKNCSYQGSVSGGDQNVGGIAGQMNNTSVVSGCSFKGTVTQVTSAKHQCGGIVGYVNTETGLVEGCTFEGTVTAACGNVGGIAGAMKGGSTIKGCTVTSTAKIEGGSIANNGIAVGGIVGYVTNSTGGKIIDNTCAGTIVSHYYDAAGIAADNRSAQVVNCTFSGTVSTDYDDSALKYDSGAINNKFSRIGGICGSMRAGSIDNCTVTGSVSGKKWTGGIVGLATGGGVNSCKVISATINGTEQIGGVVGYIERCSIKANTVTSPTISGTIYVGGVAGGTEAAGSISGCSVTGGSIKGTGMCVGGIAGYFNTGGLVSQCTTRDLTVETGHKLAGGIVGNLHECTDAKTARIENCHVYGGTVKDTADGIAGGIFGGCNGYGIVNKCSCSANITSAKNGVGGIGGWISTPNLLIANCIYYDGTLSTPGANVGGITGEFGSSTMGNTTIVNCAAFPKKIESGSGANIAGISGYVNTVTINNCYSPITSSGLLAGGAEGAASSGSIYGWLRGVNTSDACSGVIKNAYWLSGLKVGNFSKNYTYTKAEQSVTDAQMKNTGAVSMPSTGTAYPCFLDALNAGADEYNKAMVFDVRAEEWVMGTNGYPVIYGCPIASSTAVSSKKRVSFLGDSITTYKGYTLFPTNGQYPNANYTDFTSVTQTYWYQIIYNKMTNAVLEANSSHTGTCVQNTTSKGHPGFGFLNRYADLGNPDVIFINGGTNDSWSFKLPVGTLDFTIDTDALDTYQFAQAYDKLIRLLKGKYPKAKIVCIIGDSVMDSQYTAYAKIIRDVANHYEIKYAEVVFADRAASTYDNVHPNVAGMTEMANQIWNQVKDYVN